MVRLRVWSPIYQWSFRFLTKKKYSTIYIWQKWLKNLAVFVMRCLTPVFYVYIFKPQNIRSYRALVRRFPYHEYKHLYIWVPLWVFHKRVRNPIYNSPLELKRFLWNRNNKTNLLLVERWIHFFTLFLASCKLDQKQLSNQIGSHKEARA